MLINRPILILTIDLALTAGLNTTLADGATPFLVRLFIVAQIMHLHKPYLIHLGRKYVAVEQE